MLSETKIIGHRGYVTDSITENTISAFESAFKLGCDGIELDVHLSQDKEWIVHHDTTLAGLSIPKTKSDLLFKKARANGYELTTLTEVLQKFSKKEINIEIKPDSFRVGKLLGKFLQDQGSLRHIYVTSFKSKTLTGLRKSSENIKLGWITVYVSTKKWKYLNRRIGLYSINPLHYILNKQKIFEISKNKIKIQPWTVNRVGSIQKFLNFKVDAIITDRPEIALKERNNLLK
ncbi:MAG: glycerophosphodiester phosphodiesterase [Candidatus Heimdallarchaeota archaeon]